MGNDDLQNPLESLFSNCAPQHDASSSQELQAEQAWDETAETSNLATSGLFSSDVSTDKAAGKPEGVLPRATVEPDPGPVVSEGEFGASDQGSAGDPMRALRLSLLWDGERGDSLQEEAESELAQGRERILNLLLGGAVLGGGLAVLALVVGTIQDLTRLPSYVPYFVAYALILVAFVVRRTSLRWRVAVLIGAAYVVAFFSVFENGVTSTAPWYLLATPLLFFILVGDRAGVLSGIVNTAIYVILAAAYHLGLLSVRVPIEVGESLSQFLVVSTSFALISTIVVVVQLLFARAQRRIRHSLQQQGEALRESHAVGAQRQQQLERANMVLQRQAQHFDLGIQIGRVAAMGLDVSQFTDQVVRLIHERVESHYVGLFVLDPDRQYAQLQTAAGRAIDTFTPQQRRLLVSGDMLLRQCVSSGRAGILLGIDQVQSLSGGEDEAVFLLPDTRSAITLPMVARGQVFGVISVQSHSPAAFRNEDMISLRTVADQIATAISNARLAEELRSRLRELELLQQYYVKEAWDQFLTSEAARLYEYDQPGVDALGERSLPEIERVLTEPRLTILGQEEGSAPTVLVSPISLREQVLGVLGLHRTDADEPWTDEQIELVEAVSEQMGLIIENSRLFSEAQSRATRERRAREITARMRQSLDIDTVLQTAVREMGEALKLRDVTIQLLADEAMAEDQ